MQAYLLPNQILTFDDQLEIFSFWTRMNGLSYNTKGTSEIEYCKCGSEMENEHLFLCNFLNAGQVLKYKYDDLLNGTLAQQKYIITILRKNMEKHTKFSRAQDELSDASF